MIEKEEWVTLGFAAWEASWTVMDAISPHLEGRAEQEV